MDKATAIRAALNKLGERNFTENSATYPTILEEWKRALLTANAAHSWTFTRSISTLAPRKSGTADRLLVYDYPPDCLSIIQLIDGATNRRIAWRPYADRTLITRDAPTEHPTCIYNNNSLSCADSIPDHDPIFCDYFITLLASRIAPCILGGQTGIALSQNLMQEAISHLNTARTIDAQQFASNDESDPIRTYLNLNSSVRL